jgi:hypothetical protein
MVSKKDPKANSRAIPIPESIPSVSRHLPLLASSQTQYVLFGDVHCAVIHPTNARVETRSKFPVLNTISIVKLYV